MDAFDLIGYGFVAFYYAILALLCWGIYRRIKKKKWFGSSLFAFALIVLIVFPGLSWGILPGSFLYLDLVQTRQLTGRAFLLGDADLSEHSERFFNGDGYSIDVYSISEDAASAFNNPRPQFFEALPKRPSYRSDWEATRWKETPPTEDDAVFIQFAGINIDTEDSDPSNPRHVAARLLTEKGNFYAYFYYMHRDYPGNVDLFIISPKERIIVIANQNT